MKPGRELKEALASILHSGLVSLRGAAGQDRLYVEAEAQHLNNIPFCLARMHESDIRYYHEVERSRYLAALRRLGERAERIAPNYDGPWGGVIAEFLGGRPAPSKRKGKPRAGLTRRRAGDRIKP